MEISPPQAKATQSTIPEILKDSLSNISKLESNCNAPETIFTLSPIATLIFWQDNEEAEAHLRSSRYLFIIVIAFT